MEHSNTTMKNDANRTNPVGTIDDIVASTIVLTVLVTLESGATTQAEGEQETNTEPEVSVSADGSPAPVDTASQVKQTDTINATLEPTTCAATAQNDNLATPKPCRVVGLECFLTKVPPLTTFREILTRIAKNNDRAGEISDFLIINSEGKSMWSLQHCSDRQECQIILEGYTEELWDSLKRDSLLIDMTPEQLHSNDCDILVEIRRAGSRAGLGPLAFGVYPSVKGL